MSRYIDADALEDKAKQYSLGYYEEDEWAVPLKEIGEAPTIEVVSVEDYRSMENTCYKLQKALYEMADAPSIDIVRCKERKYFIDNLTENDTDETYDACRWDWEKCIPKADDFCSYGVKKGADDERGFNQKV